MENIFCTVIITSSEQTKAKTILGKPVVIMPGNFIYNDLGEIIGKVPDIMGTEPRSEMFNTGISVDGITATHYVESGFFYADELEKLVNSDILDKELRFTTNVQEVLDSKNMVVIR